jgi:hypothetical protein
VSLIVCRRCSPSQSELTWAKYRRSAPDRLGATDRLSSMTSLTNGHDHDPSAALDHDPTVGHDPTASARHQTSDQPLNDADQTEIRAGRSAVVCRRWFAERRLIEKTRFDPDLSKKNVVATHDADLTQGASSHTLKASTADGGLTYKHPALPKGRRGVM